MSRPAAASATIAALIVTGSCTTYRGLHKPACMSTPASTPAWTTTP